MIVLPRRARAALLAVLALCTLVQPPLTPARVHAAPCGTAVAVLGADVLPAARLDVLRALGAAPTAPELRETLADERAQAHGLVPPVLLGRVAVSSVLLQPRPVGAGLRVRLDRNVTLYTARAYANALLTAGVADASVAVAAPASQRALGTTALLSLLRAARLSCMTATVQRQDLAIREFVLSQALAERLGYTEAPRLMTQLKSSAVAGSGGAPSALPARIAHVEAAQGIRVPPQLNAQLAAYLRDLAASHAYANARIVFHDASALQTTVETPSSSPGPTTRATGHARGTIATTTAGILAVRQRDGIHRYRPSAGVQVYRARRRSGLPALRPGDRVQVTYGNGDTALRVDAFPASTHGPTLLHATLAAPAAVGALTTRIHGVIGHYRLARAIQIFRGGRPASAADLRPGDRLALRLDGSGAVVRIDAAPPAHAIPAAVVHVSGTLAAATRAGQAIAVRTGADVRHYRPARDLRVDRDGTPSSMAALRPGDRLLVTETGGAATRIEATGPAIPVTAPTGTNRGVAIPIALGTVAAILLALLLLGLLRRRKHRRPAQRPARGTAGTHGGGAAMRGGAWKAPLAELVGTLFLTLAALVAGTPAAVALTLGAFVYVLGNISGCHLNPAVTVGLAAARRLPAGMAVCYVLAQLGGGALARLLAPRIGPLAHHYAAGSVTGEFLGAGFLVLTVIAVSDKYVPRSGSGVAIGGALLAGLLMSRGILNPAVAVAMGQADSAATWATVLGGLVFTGLFLLLAPAQEAAEGAGEQRDAARGASKEDAVPPARPFPGAQRSA